MSRSVRRLHYGAGVALTMGIGLAGYGLCIGSDNAGPFIQSAAALAAVAGWLYNNAISLTIKLREKSFEFLNNEMVGGELLALMRPISIFWLDAKNHEIISSEERSARYYFETRYSNDSIIPDFNKLVALFEYMAILIRRDAVEETMIRDYYCGLLCRFYPRFKVFIPAARNIKDWKYHREAIPVRADVGEHIDWLYKRWSAQQASNLK